MEKKKALAFFIFFYLLKYISGDDDCRPASCSSTGPQVRFPFRLRDRQPSSCGFPGFDLSCNKKNQTVIKLQSSRSFIVKHISYAAQVINIDPDFCRPERISDVKLTDTPFDFSMVESYTFFNCSSQNLDFTFQTVPMVPFPCLGSVNHSVFAVRSRWIPQGDIPASCNDIRTISVPIRRYGDIRNELSLMWFRPYCRSCELDGRTCGLKSDGGETACFGSSHDNSQVIVRFGYTVSTLMNITDVRGIKSFWFVCAYISTGSSILFNPHRRKKYSKELKVWAKHIGIGVPALVCIIGLICYAFSKVRNYNQSHHQRIDLFSIAITPQPPTTTGLDVPTIESYPKTILGESCRLPKDDGTCAICLSDYEPKETVRTIPDCNHYFHADCIDEWLRLNATCPVCRNSPETSSLVTPCSSMSSNSSRETTQQ